MRPGTYGNHVRNDASVKAMPVATAEKLATVAAGTLRVLPRTVRVLTVIQE